MTKIQFSILDKVSGIFDNPFTATNRAEAMRYLSKVVNSEGNMISDHPQDFALYEVSTFDSESGIVDGDKPEFIVNASDFVAEQAA